MLQYGILGGAARDETMTIKGEGIVRDLGGMPIAQGSDGFVAINMHDTVCILVLLVMPRGVAIDRSMDQGNWALL